MKILLVEDQEERIQQFRRNLIGCDIDVTKDPKVAIEWLCTQDYDCLFLDHDLEGPWICPSGPGTGYEVAAFLEKHPMMQPKVIITHTYNADGAKKICQALPKAVWYYSCWVQANLLGTLEKLLQEGE